MPTPARNRASTRTSSDGVQTISTEAATKSADEKAIVGRRPAASASADAEKVPRTLPSVVAVATAPICAGVSPKCGPRKSSAPPSTPVV